MAQCHNRAILFINSGYLKAIGQTFVRYYPAMVAPNVKSVGQVFKKAFFGINYLDGCGYAMHGPAQVEQAAAKGFGNGLLTKAHPKNTFGGRVGLYHIQQQARFGWYAGPRREDDFIKLRHIGQLKLIVPPYLALQAKFVNQVNQVISKRVVIIYDQYFHGSV